ncbi:MAG: class I SAM-dependent methyltransferase [Deltaproteobacteria bacterium]|nr:class I SAM-dependent methyltransferase [Deltaproteobacteria bacterium]
MNNKDRKEREATKVLAFGVEPSNRLFRLRLSRYEALSVTLRSYVNKQDANEEKPLRLLDIGLGRGRTLRYLEPHKEIKAIEFFGLDLSVKRLENVYKASEWRLLRADACKNAPFVDEAFDVIVIEQLLEHVPTPDFVVAEAWRLLKSGGLFIVGVPTFPPVIETFRRLIVRFMKSVFGVERGHVESFTLGSLCRLIEGEGRFKVVKKQGFRILSGGVFSPLEDKRWWWRLNSFFGNLLPWLCTEVQVSAVKKS